jgi:hypothetical protein
MEELQQYRHLPDLREKKLTEDEENDTVRDE